MGEFSPNAVTNLVATVVSINEIDLSWMNDNSGFESGALIERTVGLPAGDAPRGQFQTLATVTANVSTYVDMTVVAGTLYQYRVTALPASSAMFTPAKGVVVNATTPGVAPHNFAQPLGRLGFSSASLKLVTDGSWNG
jgi:hypothetical protein